MKAMLRVLGLCAVVIYGSGCVDVSTEVFVKKDGSAQIAQAVYVAPAALAMMSQQSGGGDAELFEEADLRDMAKSMGKGATFVGMERRTRKDGAKGFVARYSIPNVNDLTLEESMTAPGGTSLGSAGFAEEPADETDKSESIRFRFTPGDEPTVAIAIPQEAANAAAAEAAPILDTIPQEEPPPEVAAQMKMMFQGMRMWVRVRVEGAITETNALHVSEKKDHVSLMRIDFEKLAADEKGFAKLQALGQEASPEDMRKALKDLPYLQIEDQPRISIKFK